MIPLVSVKMLAYNHAPYIKAAIEGVLMQKTDFDFELVIGEDCSTDNTLEIIESYQKKYPTIIKVITSETNVGARANAHRTREACVGEFLAFCEGDDYWTDEYKLQKEVDFLRANHDFAAVYTDVDFYYQASAKIQHNYYRAVKKRVLEGDIFKQLLMHHDFLAPCSALFRREIVVNAIAQFRNQNFIVGDYPLWLEVSANYKIGFLAESTAVYRVLENSASHFVDLEKEFNFFDGIHDIKLFFIHRYDAPVDIVRFIELAYYKRRLNYAFLIDNQDVFYSCYIMLKTERLGWRLRGKIESKRILIHLPIVAPVIRFLMLFKKRIT